MFIIGNDETDKLNLPFHSNRRHNVHKQWSCVCTQCYRYVDRQGQQVVTHNGGEIASGVRGTTLPPASGLPQKKDLGNYME